MLSEKQIEKISQTISSGNRGHAEKLYIQDIILSTISRETVDELVFKGGTALFKFYQLDRFSEDLGFTARQEIDFEELVRKVVRDLENYGATVQERSDEEKDKSFSTRLGVQGPLYTGDRRSLNFIRIETNKKTGVENFHNLRYNPKFQDVTSFELAVLDEKEILAEKIRAVMTRKQPRDLYDIYHLLQKDVELDPELTQKKLDYYNLRYDPEKIVEEARKLEKNWSSLETLTYSPTPSFHQALETLEKAVTENQT